MLFSSVVGLVGCVIWSSVDNVWIGVGIFFAGVAVRGVFSEGKGRPEVVSGVVSTETGL